MIHVWEVPAEDSPSNLKPLRGHTVESRIDDKIMEEAMVKPLMVLSLKNDHLVLSFRNIHLTNKVGGKYSRIGYGVLYEGVYCESS